MYTHTCGESTTHTLVEGWWGLYTHTCGGVLGTVHTHLLWVLYTHTCGGVMGTVHTHTPGCDNNFFPTCPVGQVDEFSTCPSGKTSCPCHILKIN